eukprot:TRINITY_DN21813_c0_g1_i1.p1 TRINITY_DN21813_c0_g1~~TRINITY_DN21813_c0_g1_i1.p1  ORF type:complete len:159 (+),score=26.87 TRINITY_DN21813_c0_g1_i1:70-546(+)
MAQQQHRTLSLPFIDAKIQKLRNKIINKDDEDDGPLSEGMIEKTEALLTSFMKKSYLEPTTVGSSGPDETEIHWNFRRINGTEGKFISVMIYSPDEEHQDYWGYVGISGVLAKTTMANVHDYNKVGQVLQYCFSLDHYTKHDEEKVRGTYERIMLSPQ